MLIKAEKIVVSELNQNPINVSHKTFPNEVGTATAILGRDKTPQYYELSGKSRVRILCPATLDQYIEYLQTKFDY